MSTKSDPKAVLRRLNKAALNWADNPASLEYMLRTNLDDFSFLRTAGLSWGQIWRGLPDWTRRSGAPISIDQLRGAYSRLNRKRKLPPVKRIEEANTSAQEKGRLPSVPPNFLSGKDGNGSGLLARLRQTAKARE